ncbi:hypothetical protein ACFQ6N_36995 [Kitasatospora sp. NPDC056446]|uniref:hypothetical protein n=1 Tax=Kitasatospora sp. NPDC056446 TaxID=3345819 RepID=UPI00369C3D3D
MRRWFQPGRLMVLVAVLVLTVGGIVWSLGYGPTSGTGPPHLFVQPSRFVTESPGPSRALSAAIDRTVTFRTGEQRGPVGRAVLVAYEAETALVVWPTAAGELCSVAVRPRDSRPPLHCAPARNPTDGREPVLTPYPTDGDTVPGISVYLVVADLETIDRLRCGQEPLVLPEPLFTVALPGGGLRTVYAVYPGGEVQGSVEATVLRDGAEASDHVDYPQPLTTAGPLKLCDPIATPSAPPR